jgi:dihydroorotase
VADVLIEDGRISAVGDGLEAGDATVIEAAGHLVFPGLCDMHVHFREPGYEYKETVTTGARAGARGGFTDVACMPNTDPPIDDLPTVRLILERATEAGACRVHPIACITIGQQGEELTQMAELREAGAVAFSDDGLPVRSAEIMRRALEYGRMVGVPIIDHCEDPDLAAGGVMHEGAMSTQLGLRGIPAAAEEVMVGRDLQLAMLTGGNLHLAHVSTAGSVELIRAAKARGIRVTAEATPHHLVLTDEAVRTYDPVTKVNPPLREGADVESLRAAIADGTIDAIATDHAPHSVDEKQLEYDRAPFGMLGVETAVGLVITELVGGGVIDLQGMVRTMSDAPRRILDLEVIRIAAGATADLTVVDPELRWTVDPDDMLSRSRNSPFAGRELRGAAVWTIVEGRVAYDARAAASGTRNDREGVASR